MTCTFDQVVIVKGEIRRLSLLGLKGWSKNQDKASPYLSSNTWPYSTLPMATYQWNHWPNWASLSSTTYGKASRGRPVLMLPHANYVSYKQGEEGEHLCLLLMSWGNFFELSLMSRIHHFLQSFQLLWNGIIFNTLVKNSIKNIFITEKNYLQSQKLFNSRLI